jgi:drug/metabolite transporter (DMT)-like permease
MSDKRAPQTGDGAAFTMLVLAVAIWGGHWVVARALRYDAPPVALAFWRWTIAFAAFAALAGRALLRDGPRILVRWRAMVLLALSAAVLQHVTVYFGLRLTTATNAALLHATTPVCILLLARVLLGERISGGQAAGVAASAIGVLCIVSQGEPARLAALQVNPGDLLVLASAVAWATYTILLRWWPSDVDAMATFAVLAGFAVALLAPLYALEIASGRHLVPTTEALAGIGYIALLSTVIAYTLWNRGVAVVGPARAGPFMHLMIVFTPLFAALFLGEQLRAYQVAGVALILAGIAVASRGSKI